MDLRKAIIIDAKQVANAAMRDSGAKEKFNFSMREHMEAHMFLRENGIERKGEKYFKGEELIAKIVYKYSQKKICLCYRVLGASVIFGNESCVLKD